MIVGGIDEEAVQIAGTVQNIPGPVVQATVIYPAASLTGTLGRPFVGGATAGINVIAPATEYGDRLNQLDFRVGKVLRFGKARAALNVDRTASGCTTTLPVRKAKAAHDD